tara:strand:- start:22 stop:477 length:456 start_codon:yes stop_codon:yes gene_type:complete
MREKLNSELKSSIINKNVVAVKTLRLIIAAIKDRDIVVRSSGNKTGIDDSEIISLLKKMIKQREESIILYKKGKRDDLVKNEENEINIISKFLPAQLTESEVKSIVIEVIKKENAKSIKDMGKVINAIKQDYPNNIDFSFASKIIKDMLLQ